MLPKVREPEAKVILNRTTELTDAELEEVRSLGRAVYPPEQLADWPGRHIEWATPEWSVRVLDETGKVLSYVGVYLREATHDGRAVLIGGIGNVKTHPTARGCGFAKLGIQCAVRFFEEQDVTFGLLVCHEELVGYYARLGWKLFAGRLLVQQHGTVTDFTFCRAMTVGCHSDGPMAGTIDLGGLPW